MVCAYLASVLLVLLWLVYGNPTTPQEDGEGSSGLPDPGRVSEFIKVRPEDLQGYQNCF